LNRLQRPLSQVLDGAALGDWRPLVQAWRASAAGRTLTAAVDAQVVAGAVVYPGQVFRALELTPKAAVRVVILGQDPYHGPGQAEGLAFSVPPGVRVPPSLRNIFKELQRDLGQAVPASGSLTAWCAQGVLLLNSALTVLAGQAGSHSRLGWQALTEAVVTALAQDPAPKVFMLWGAHAQAQAARVQQGGAGHLLLQCNHPSPLAALRPPVPFIGCGHFGRARDFMATSGRGSLVWALA
jgi:uracil-DNA glycosylase